MLTNRAITSAPPRVAIVVSHPIQHFCPQYASLAGLGLFHLRVFFASTIGRDPYHDPNFGEEVAWDLPLARFDHIFLNDEPLPSSKSLDSPALSDALDEFDPEVIIIYGQWQRYQRRARRWARTNNKLLYYISDTEEAHRSTPFTSFVKRFLRRPLFREVERVLTVGNWNEFYYKSVGVPPDRMTRMCFPIDRERYERGYKDRDGLRMKMRAKLLLDDDDFVVSTVGKLVPWKRQMEVVKACLMIPRHRSVKLLLIGSGPDYDRIAQYVRENDAGCVIRMCGFCPAEELPGYFAASDLYVHPSAREPHSLAISEAAYFSLPLIISDRCGSYGTYDDVQNGRNGYVYKSGDVTTLASRVSQFASCHRTAKAFGARSREYQLWAQQTAHGEFLIDALRADGVLAHDIEQPE